MKKTCKYCGRPAEYTSKNGIPCCEVTWHKCPAIRDKYKKSQLRIHKNSNAALMRKTLKEGKGICKYCGKPANYLIYKKILCCQKKAKECPEYKNYISKIFKKKYKDNPKLLKFQRKNVRKIAINSEVQEKKRRKMLELHHGTTEEAKKFQENFKKAHIKRRIKKC